MSLEASQAEQQLIQTASHNFSANLAGAAALAWLIFDIVLTLEQEICHVWRQKWTLQKVLYLLVRYYTAFTLASLFAANAITDPSLAFCKQFLQWNVYGTMLVTLGLGDIMFATRIYAAYGQSRKLLVFLIVLLLLEIVVGYVLSYIEVVSLVILPRPSGYPLPGCNSSLPKDNKINLIFWITEFLVSGTCI